MSIITKILIIIASSDEDFINRYYRIATKEDNFNSFEGLENLSPTKTKTKQLGHFTKEWGLFLFQCYS